jgi:hypothetical protein
MRLPRTCKEARLAELKNAYRGWRIELMAGYKADEKRGDFGMMPKGKNLTTSVGFKRSTNSCGVSASLETRSRPILAFENGSNRFTIGPSADEAISISRERAAKLNGVSLAPSHTAQASS